MSKILSESKILDEIKTRLKQAEDYWQENYQRGVEDKEFVTVEGAQWGLHEVQKRKDDGKPSLIHRHTGGLEMYTNQ